MGASSARMAKLWHQLRDAYHVMLSELARNTVHTATLLGLDTEGALAPDDPSLLSTWFESLYVLTRNVRRAVAARVQPCEQSELASDNLQKRTQFPSNMGLQLHRAMTTYLLQPHRSLHVTAMRSEVQLLTRLRVVDNSDIGRQAMSEGKPPKIIHVYNKTGIGKLGDRVLVAIKGQKKKGILVGAKQTQQPMIPKFDSNNVVLIDDNGTPLGTRIHVPIPNILRTILRKNTRAKGADYTKLLAIAPRFV